MDIDLCMIITGNPVDGFRYIGPFSNHSLAAEYAEHYRWDNDNHIDEGDWWIATIEPRDPSWESGGHKNG